MRENGVFYVESQCEGELLEIEGEWCIDFDFPFLRVRLEVRLLNDVTILPGRSHVTRLTDLSIPAA